MKLRFKALLVLVLLAHLFSTSLVWACSPPFYSTIKGRCTPTGESQSLFQFQLSRPSNLATASNTLQTNLNQLATVCGVEEQATIEQLKEVMEKWTIEYQFIFEPYSPGREQELQAEEQDLLVCRYNRYQKVGSWLLITPTLREYCFAYCGFNETIVFPVFLLTLIQQPNSVTLPYLAFFALLTGLSVAFFYQIIPSHLEKYGSIFYLFFVAPFACWLLFLFPPSVGGRLETQGLGWLLSCVLLAYVWRTIQTLIKRKRLAKTEGVKLL